MYDNKTKCIDSDGKSKFDPVSIPSFEELADLAENDPLEFEMLRVRLCSQVIDNAPGYLQKRLQGLQFKVDMERKRSKSTYMTCLKISEMMNESLAELSMVLTNPDEYHRQVKSRQCEVVPLFGE